MKTKILKYFLIAWICLSLFMIIGSKNTKLATLFINSEEFTDLSYRAKLSNFMENIIRFPKKHIENSSENSIILIGDSFIENSINSFSFADLLHEELNGNLNVFYRLKNDMLLDPVQRFSEMELDLQKQRLLIWEIAELGAYSYGIEKIKSENTQFTKTQILTNKIFNHKDMDYFAKNNSIFFPILKFFSELRYFILKECNNSIGRFSIDPKMLFLKKYVDYGENKKDEAVIEKALYFIEEQNRILKENYNTEIVIIIIPQKYTIYSNLFENSLEYDDFICKFQYRLDMIGIKYIDIFSRYKQYREINDSELLYFMSDTHFTPLGKQIVLEETVKFLLENNLLDEIDD